MSVRRAIELVGAGITLELSIVTMVRIEKKLFLLDELSDGTWRLIYSASAFTEIENLESIDIRDSQLVFVGLDKSFQLMKASAVKTDANMIHLEETKDGRWKILYNGDHIKKFNDVKQIKVVRGD